MAAIVGVEIGDLGPSAGATEGCLDPGACGPILVIVVGPLVGQAARAAKDFALPMRKIGQGHQHSLMQWHAACVAVLGLSEDHMPAFEVDGSPSGQYHLAGAGPCKEQQEGNEREA